MSLIIYHAGINTAAFHKEELVDALSILYQAIKPARVHCWHGSDRTSMVVALYRLIFNNAFGSDTLADIATVDVDALRQRVLNHSR